MIPETHLQIHTHIPPTLRVLVSSKKNLDILRWKMTGPDQFSHPHQIMTPQTRHMKLKAKKPMAVQDSERRQSLLLLVLRKVWLASQTQADIVSLPTRLSQSNYVSYSVHPPSHLQPSGPAPCSQDMNSGAFLLRTLLWTSGPPLCSSLHLSILIYLYQY